MRAKVLKVKLSECREFQDTGADLGRTLGQSKWRNSKKKRFITHWGNPLKHTQFFLVTSRTNIGIHSFTESHQYAYTNNIILYLSKCSAGSKIKDRISRLWWRYHHIRSWCWHDSVHLFLRYRLSLTLHRSFSPCEINAIYPQIISLWEYIFWKTGHLLFIWRRW